MKAWGRWILAFAIVFDFRLVVVPAVNDVVPYPGEVSRNVGGVGDFAAVGVVDIENDALLPVPT